MTADQHFLVGLTIVGLYGAVAMAALGRWVDRHPTVSHPCDTCHSGNTESPESVLPDASSPRK
jgi:hypothetical protein